MDLMEIPDILFEVIIGRVFDDVIKINSKQKLKDGFIEDARFISEYKMEIDEEELPRLQEALSKKNIKQIYKELKKLKNYDYKYFLKIKYEKLLDKYGVSKSRIVDWLVDLNIQVINKYDEELSKKIYMNDFRNETSNGIDKLKCKLDEQSSDIREIKDAVEQMKNRQTLSKNDKCDEDYSDSDNKLYERITKCFKAFEYIFKEGNFGVGINQIYYERLNDLLEETRGLSYSFSDESLDKTWVSLLEGLKKFNGYSAYHMEPKGSLFIINGKEERYKSPQVSKEFEEVVNTLQELAEDVWAKYNEFINAFVGK